MRAAKQKTIFGFNQAGVTLIELVVFIVIVSIALVTLLSVLAAGVTRSYDPVARIRGVEKGQALLDEILSRKFAHNTPTGGVPACSPCDPIGTGGDDNDVGDYHGYNDGAATYQASVTVTNAGGDLAIAADQARLITVTVALPDGDSVVLSAYRTNF